MLKGVHINTEIGEPGAAGAAELVIAMIRGTENFRGYQRIREIDGDAPCEMVVASSREIHIFRRSRPWHRGAGSRKRGNRAERFERVSDIGTGKRVVAMAASAAHGKQPAIEKLRKMAAGRLRGNIRGERQFSCGARLSIQQRHQDRRASGVADQVSDGGDRVGCVHAVILA